MPLPNVKPERKKRGPVFPFMLLMAAACVLYQATQDAPDQDYESEGETKRHKAVPVLFVGGGEELGGSRSVLGVWTMVGSSVGPSVEQGSIGLLRRPFLWQNPG